MGNGNHQPAASDLITELSSYVVVCLEPRSGPKIGRGSSLGIATQPLQCNICLTALSRCFLLLAVKLFEALQRFTVLHMVIYSSTWPTWQVLLLPIALAQSISEPNSAGYPLRIWQSIPAVNWNDSFLIGNGRLGAVVPGGAQVDTMHFNEDSLWSGGPLHRVNPSAASQIPIMQSYILRGMKDDPLLIESAATLASYAYVGTPVSTQHYDPLLDFTLSMNHGSDIVDYERWLDIGDSTTGIYYKVGDVAYEREILASEPAGLIAMRIAANQSHAVSFSIHLDRLTESLNRWEGYSIPVGDDTVVMGGASEGMDPIVFAAGARVIVTGGTVETLGDYVICNNATEAHVYFQAWTDYRQTDPKAAVMSDLASISQSYSDIRAAHVEDYQSFANRTSLNFGTSSAAQKQMTTSDRMIAVTNGPFDPEVASLYFEYGRYLLISTSRSMEKSLPPNLQGIWNSDLDPMWGCRVRNNPS